MRAGAPVLQPLPRALEACVSSLILISLPNGSDQRLATLDYPHRPILSRVRCIGLLDRAGS
jgi:hypothetical protein